MPSTQGSSACQIPWRKLERVGRKPGPAGLGAHLGKNRPARRLARGNPGPDTRAHPRSRPRRRLGVEVDGHSGLVARRRHLHRRDVQELREPHVCQGRVPEGVGPALQLESRLQRTPRDRYPRRKSGRCVRFQGVRSPDGCRQQRCQLEIFEEGELTKGDTTEETSMKQLKIVTLVVKDYDPAIAFDAQKLGFTLVEDKLFGDRRWITLSLPGNHCALALELAKTPEDLAIVGRQGGS